MTQLQPYGRGNNVPARYEGKGRSVELRSIPRTPAPRRAALDEYPEYADDIRALRRVGIASVHGFFPLEAWERTCASICLYMLPMSGTAQGRLSEIKAEIDARAMRLTWVERQLGHSRQGIALAVLNEMSAAGTLLPSVFPDHRQAVSRWHPVGFDYPLPPKDVEAVTNKARLAGYEPMIAIPGRYIKLNNLADIIDTEPERAPADRDPIVYAVRDKTAVVLTHYGDIDAGPMAALVEVLKDMDVQL